MAKSEMLRMLVNPLNVAVEAVEELEQKIKLFEEDHGMEPSFSSRINGTQPKYSKTIQSLVELNKKQRDTIKTMESEIDSHLEHIDGLEEKVRILEARSAVFSRLQTKDTTQAD